MKVLKVPNNMKDILRWSFGDKFLVEDKKINLYDYPLMIKKTSCKRGHVAKTYLEAVEISKGTCYACDHLGAI